MLRLSHRRTLPELQIRRRIELVFERRVDRLAGGRANKVQPVYCSFQTVSSGRLNVTRDLIIGSLVIGSSTYVMRDGEPIGLEIVHSARDSG